VDLKNGLHVSEEDCSSWTSETGKTGPHRKEAICVLLLIVYQSSTGCCSFCLDFILVNTKNEDSHKTSSA
jgi:hypothetical protein